MAHPLNVTSSRFNRRALLRGVIGVAAASASPWRTAQAAPALASGGAKIELSDAAVSDLQKSIKGTVILPASPDYERARRVWSPVYDRKPALIANCTSLDDIKATLQFARKNDLLTAIRCGGHSSSGYSTVDGGLIMDISGFNGVEVDPAKKIARVKGGSFLGHLDRATAPHKLATTAGTVSHTGVGGLATGGGQGRLARKFGLTIDNFLEAEVLLADGRLVRANTKENPDLFWAVRGGGGNFGIVTEFVFQLHDFEQVISSFSYTFPVDKVKDTLKLYLEMCAAAPPELSLSANMRISDRGTVTAGISGNFLGPKAAAEKAVAALQVLGTPVAYRMDEMAYVRQQSVGDGPVLSDRFAYGRNSFFSKLDAKTIDMLVDEMMRAAVPRTSIRFAYQGGAISKVAASATAFAQRDGLFSCSVDVDWAAGVDPAPGIKHVRDFHKQFESLTTGGPYVNAIYDDPEDRIRQAYRGNYKRLVDIKTKVDPTNFFHMNANIKPKTQPV